LTRKLEKLFSISGRSVSMEGRNKNPDTGSIKRIVNRMGSEDLVERRIGLVQRIQRR
jgi:hypothetical protein